ncbi:MAG TPA: 2-oxoglutarate dehydrogenase E1 component, partial [Pirellulales bacterium]
DRAIETAGDQGIEEVVLAMAHRGRLNVLANIMGKHPRAIFREFADADAQALRGRGDVKYHLGYSSDRITASGKKIHLSLCFNPSHLEFVNPVALGRIRAKQDRVRDAFRNQGMVVLIHGDAAFAGEGVIQETFNLSQLQAYETGGTLHVIVNNQIGFTTPPQQGRSCSYATDVAKMLQIPIFHVNGEDPEAVAQVVKLAMDFRREFKRDVVIDLYCYRKYGHNEGDDASFTQPTMVRDIESRRSVNENYLDRLLEMGGISRAEADEMAERLRKEYAAELDLSKGEDFKPFPENVVSYWKGYKGGRDSSVPEANTGLPLEQLQHTLRKLTEIPEWFHVHPKLQKVLENRRAMADGALPVDWAAGEALAFGTLAEHGTRIRFSGQDVERGTFSHRHAVLHDYNDGRPYMPLKNLSPDQAPVEIANSPLSEIAVLGFEYGYSLDYPDALVIWEAQFGDFVNVAQVIIDQFISSAEDKWRRLSGVVMLLPHGFEGNGPEHSSARLERFLTLAAEDNMQICNVTTPAQYFHMLRRQVVRPLRKPLIVMTPKSLLRHKKVVSSLSEFAEGGFKRILPDVDPKRTDVDRVLLCSGKIYYDLEEHREKLARQDVAILRVEQLYPLSDEAIEEALAPYAAGTPVMWVQEEPENMGAWRHFRARFGDSVLERYPFSGVYREASASPATGSHKAHELEQHDLLDQAFAKALVPASSRS